jgi:Bax protein
MTQENSNQSSNGLSANIKLLIGAVIVLVVAVALYFITSEKEKTESLPDFSQHKDIKKMKQAFFSYLKPLAEQVNQSIKQDKVEFDQLYSSFEKNNSLSDAQWQDIFELAKKYRMGDDALSKNTELLEELKLRIHPLPTSLVLAQAANESAWGRSRFAKQGNNLFGQWCFKSGCGIVPKSRPEGETYEVAFFNSPKASIKSYMMNLNTFSAYEELREKRQQLIASGKRVTGKALAEGLLNYSTRREEYVKEIQAMIRQNNLE